MNVYNITVVEKVAIEFILTYIISGEMEFRSITVIMVTLHTPNSAH